MKLCPECLSPLDHVQHKVFECWRCPEDHGTLYPKGELEKVVAAVAGLGEVDMNIWSDHDRYSVIQSPLINPETHTPLLEVRDKQFMNIIIYGDPVTQDLWVHSGEEEKLLEHIERAQEADSVGTYLKIAAGEAAKIFDDDENSIEAAGHLVTALKLLGDRLLRAFPTFSI
ncbi:TFIIB-type zinc ribbon-containing protein [Acanthopleuribacter pedis]|uniref:Zf-TFIIB domain-containing protein n=1 Tax=Acanthopleuribacter pedis TaxID=442870 RepID=A0A8J7Q0E7_9BACT|nr:zf-TFIIB domain-containing protein [Acanthopleuribacter pedis]MBO1316974.1 zf-TFIIB domain-containing protein [Acanthopleuribacter pedis]